MKRLMISGFASIALLAAATAMLWSHMPASGRTIASAGTVPPPQELHTPAGVNQLPIEDFEDMSLVYPTATKR